MKNHTVTIPLPFGVSQADIERDTSVLVDFTEAVSLWCPHLALGGIYRPDTKQWTLFYPCTEEELLSGLAQWAHFTGLLDKAKSVRPVFKKEWTIN